MNAPPRAYRLWLLLLVGFTLVRGAALAVLLPAWQAPDEPGHYEFARLVDRFGWHAGPENRTAALQAEIIADLAQADFWRQVRAATPDPLPETFDADPFLARSGAQVGDEPPAYYALLAVLWRGWPGASIRQQLLIGRLGSVCLLTLAVLLAAWAARRAWPADRRMAYALPGFVALHPMAAFMGAALNNDALALLAGVAGAAVLLWSSRPDAPRGRLALLFGMPIIGLGAKKTTLFLAPLALVLALCLSGVPRVGRWLGGRPVIRRSAAIVLLVAAVLVALWLAGGVADRPAAWVTEGGAAHGNRVLLPDGPALALTDNDLGHRALLEQTVTWHAGAPAQSVRLTTQVRTDDGQEGAVEVSVRVAAGAEAGETVCTAGPAWTECALTYALPAPASKLRVVLAVGAKGHTAVEGRVYWRAVRLAPAAGPGEANWMANPDGAVMARQAMPLALWLERSLQAPRGWLVALARPENWSAGALARYGIYALLAFASFWGNFGWLQAPLPWPFYLGWLALCGVATVGLVNWLARRLIDRAGGLTAALRRDAAAWLCVGAVWLALAQVTLPMIGFAWQPQGRYLLPALLPIGVCLILGLRAAWPARWRGSAEAVLLGTLALANVAMFGVLAARW